MTIKMKNIIRLTLWLLIIASLVLLIVSTTMSVQIGEQIFKGEVVETADSYLVTNILLAIGLAVLIASTIGVLFYEKIKTKLHGVLLGVIVCCGNPFAGIMMIIQQTSEYPVNAQSTEQMSILEDILINAQELLMRALTWIGVFLLDIVKSLGIVIVSIFKAIGYICRGIYNYIRHFIRRVQEFELDGYLSHILMGYTHIKNKQYANGIFYLLVEIAFPILFFTLVLYDNGNVRYTLFTAMTLLTSLGTIKTYDNEPCDPFIQSCDDYVLRVFGDESFLIMLYGIVGIILLVGFIYLWNKNLQSAYNINKMNKNRSYIKAYESQIFAIDNSFEIINDIRTSENDGISFNELVNKKYGWNSLSASYVKQLKLSKSTNSVVLFMNKISSSISEMFDKLCICVTNLITKQKKVYVKPSALEIEKKRLDNLRSDAVMNLTLQHRNFDRFNSYDEVVHNKSRIIYHIENLQETMRVANFEQMLQQEEIVALGRKLSKIDTNIFRSQQIIKHAKNIDDLKELLAYDECSIVGAKARKNHFRDIMIEKLAYDSGCANYIIDSLLDKDGNIESENKLKIIIEANTREINKRLPKDLRIVFATRLVAAYGYSFDFAKEVAKILMDKRSIKPREDLNPTLEATKNELQLFIEAHPDKDAPRSASFKQQVAELLNEKFSITVLLLPTIGVVIFTIVPLIFMILVAFTNFNSDHQPPLNLFTWVGFDNFIELFSGGIAESSKLPNTLISLTTWTIIWAIFATFTNYIFGMVLALIINRKGIRLKKLWRTVFVITIAIPQFITLLVISRLLADTGPLVSALAELVGDPELKLRLLSDTSFNGLLPRIMVIVVNLWVGMPYTMLMTSGILMNIPEDLYESARIDGASSNTQFWKITLPYMLFVTGPYLITSFVGNINNFGVIFFLTGGGPADNALYEAGKTDLLITWLYKLTVTAPEKQYALASTIGIFVFIVCSFISIIMYSKTGAVTKEEDFQ